MRKYGNTKCASRDGKVFDSMRERNRYEELLLLARIGEISDLETQVEYLLIPKQMGGKRHERAVHYVADFRYKDKAGIEHTEDVKGFRTKEYILKRKLMLQVHGIAIEEF